MWAPLLSFPVDQLGRRGSGRFALQLRPPRRLVAVPAPASTALRPGASARRRPRAASTRHPQSFLLGPRPSLRPSPRPSPTAATARWRRMWPQSAWPTTKSMPQMEQLCNLYTPPATTARRRSFRGNHDCGGRRRESGCAPCRRCPGPAG